jgi:hypothetical protein
MINPGIVRNGDRPARLAAGKTMTQICLTIDTEFSIGGAFANPYRYRPISNEIVNCAVEGVDEGLGFLLDTFGNYGVHATFFVEVLQSFYFGSERMGAVAERIARAGHDVQPHLHPCWMHFRDPTWRQLREANDSCAGRTQAEIEDMIGIAREIFRKWNLPAPISIRTGGCQCDTTVYAAMRQCGIPLASSVAMGLYRAPDPSLRLASGRTFVEGVMEIPVLAYLDPTLHMRPAIRNAAITATSSREMQALLWEAREEEISPVVILTHPFEFVKRDDFRYRSLRRNGVNQSRLKTLLEFVAHNSDCFEMATFAENGPAWLAAGGAPSKMLTVPRPLALMRAMENFINDRV